MGCSVEQSINEALRDCGACVATGAQRNWVLAQRMAQDFASPGLQTTLQLNVPTIDAQGRIAHIRGFALVGKANITTGAANTAVSKYSLKKLYGQLVMEDVTGHQFWQGLDARSLEDETWVRHQGKIQALLGREQWGLQGLSPVITNADGVPQNVGAGTADYDMSWYFPNTRLDSEANPLEGLVTLSSLQLSVQGGFRIKWGQTADLPGLPTGVTLNSFKRYDGALGFDLYLDMVYIPAVVADEAWQILHGVMQQQDGNIPQTGNRRTESLSLRYLQEDANPTVAAMNGWDLARQCEGLTFRVAGNTFLSAATNQDAVIRGMLFSGSARHGAHVTDNAAMDLPLTGPGTVDQQLATPNILQILPFAPRELAAAGFVNVQATTRTPTFWRWLQRLVACPGGAAQAARAAAIYRAAQCGPCGGIFSTTPRGEKTGLMSNSRPLVLQPSKFMARKA